MYYKISFFIKNMFYSLIFISVKNKKSGSAAGFPDKSLWKKWYLNTEFLTDVFWKRVLVQHHVHELISNKCLCHVPCSFIVTILTP